MGLSSWHILLVLIVFVLLFGSGKISGLMGDLAKGVKSFKNVMSEGESEAEPAPEAQPAPKVIGHKAAKPAPREARRPDRAKAPSGSS
jgi:sec-independent protein translocase protein TatA